MSKSNNIDRVTSIVEKNTGDPQPETAARHTVLQIATRGGMPLPAAETALEDAVELGRLVEEDGRYRLA